MENYVRLSETKIKNDEKARKTKELFNNSTANTVLFWFIIKNIYVVNEENTTICNIEGRKFQNRDFIRV